ncbi:MAG: hypothetical protein MUO31_12385, partial [Thermodesulfovibrionales bacterium]|nr:hypothetical protein [Thermodesulfovibrionales bacterium]
PSWHSCWACLYNSSHRSFLHMKPRKSGLMRLHGKVHLKADTGDTRNQFPLRAFSASSPA